MLGAHNVTGWRPEKISAQGLGRSYQKTTIFLPFSVWENVRLAAQSRQPNAARWLSRAGSFAAVNARAERALELAGLQDRKMSIAGTISHGEQRQLEIAMTLATEPQVLLLDEPLAGMGVAEAERMVTLLKSLMGLVRPRSGAIAIAGRPMMGRTPYEIARLGIAYVPEGRGIFGNLSVLENLKMAARAGTRGQRDWTYERVLETFPRLKERLGHGGQQLSGGEQQMLTIGRALMTNPDV